MFEVWTLSSIAECRLDSSCFADLLEGTDTVNVGYVYRLREYIVAYPKLVSVVILHKDDGVSKMSSELPVL